MYGSYEVLEDSDFATQLPTLLADAKDRLEEAAFATGSGSGQPFGVVTRATATALGGGATRRPQPAAEQLPATLVEKTP